MKIFAALVTLAALVTAWTASAAAGAPTDQVREYSEAVVKVLEDPTLKPEDRRSAVRKIAQDVFDMQETARRALGTHWQARTPAEREEFVALFAELLEATYIHKIDLYGGERLRVLSETIDGDTAVVRGRVVTRRGTEVPVEARMQKKGDRWYIYDVTIENVSLVANYRSQFDRIIRTASYDELVKRLRSRALLNGREPGSARRTTP